MRRRSQTDFIVVHCADTPVTFNGGLEVITDWHTLPEPDGNGWPHVGYHYVIKRDGEIEYGVDKNMMGIHVKGHNWHTVAICLVGGQGSDGFAEDNFTAEQKRKLYLLIQALLEEYPGAAVQGHRDFAGVTKQCPCFNVSEWFWGMEGDRD